MGGSKRKHLDMDARKAIEDGIGDKLTAREIARRIDVSQTTVTREVKANRTARSRRESTSALGRGAPASTSAGTPARSAEPARRRRRPGAAGGARP